MHSACNLNPSDYMRMAAREGYPAVEYAPAISSKLHEERKCSLLRIHRIEGIQAANVQHTCSIN